MARTRKWDGRTDVRTDGRTGRTGVTLNAFRYSSNTRGHKNEKKERNDETLSHISYYNH